MLPEGSQIPSKRWCNSAAREDYSKLVLRLSWDAGVTAPPSPNPCHRGCMLAQALRRHSTSHEHVLELRASVLDRTFPSVAKNKRKQSTSTPDTLPRHPKGTSAVSWSRWGRGGRRQLGGTTRRRLLAVCEACSVIAERFRRSRGFVLCGLSRRPHREGSRRRLQR